MNQLRGISLVAQCQEHLVDVMRAIPDCIPGGSGLCQQDLASAAGFKVLGDRRDAWFVEVLLGRLECNGRVEAHRVSPRGMKRFRLSG